MPRYAALLRAVNVGGRKVTMADLRTAATELGYGNARTLLASGNLVFDAKKTAPEKLESMLEAAIEKAFGLFSEVMVRDFSDLAAIIRANPFPRKAKDDPAHLVVLLCKTEPDTAALEACLKAYREKYDAGERVKAIGREIYIDYGPSIGKSKLLIPKKVCIGTGRNWNTMLKLAGMLND
jgi:uncharacterized protein (DUF1697 family)